MGLGVMHEGRFYTVPELAEQSGLSDVTIRSRMRKHPEWGYEELTAEDTRNKYYVEHDGKHLSLKEWSTLLGVHYATALDRYQRGERDFYKLFKGGCIMPLRIRDEDIRWLRQTRWARKGQADEWLVACDLIGVPRIYADEIRGLLSDGEG